MLGNVVSGLAAAMAIEDSQMRALALKAAMDAAHLPAPPGFDVASAAAAASQYLSHNLSAPGSVPVAAEGHGTGGSMWVRTMEKAQSVKMPLDDAAAKGGEDEDVARTSHNADETPHQYELLMQAMAGLTGIGGQGAVDQGGEDKAGGMPIAGTAAGDVEPVGREARAAAAAAAAEARFKVAELSEGGVEGEHLGLLEPSEDGAATAAAAAVQAQPATSAPDEIVSHSQQGEGQEGGTQEGEEEEEEEGGQQEQGEVEEQQQQGEAHSSHVDDDLEAKVIKIQVRTCSWCRINALHGLLDCQGKQGGSMDEL